MYIVYYTYCMIHHMYGHFIFENWWCDLLERPRLWLAWATRQTVEVTTQDSAAPGPLPLNDKQTTESTYHSTWEWVPGWDCFTDILRPAERGGVGENDRRIKRCWKNSLRPFGPKLWSFAYSFVLTLLTYLSCAQSLKIWESKVLTNCHFAPTLLRRAGLKPCRSTWRRRVPTHRCFSESFFWEGDHQNATELNPSFCGGTYLAILPCLCRFSRPQSFRRGETSWRMISRTWFGHVWSNEQKEIEPNESNESQDFLLVDIFAIQVLFFLRSPWKSFEKGTAGLDPADSCQLNAMSRLVGSNDLMNLRSLSCENQWCSFIPSSPWMCHQPAF